MAVTVLRLDHRPERDKRVTTHCALVARAFGAKELIYSGEKDVKFEQTVKDVVKSWGGPFTVKYTKSWRSAIKNFKGKKVQLTMYGLPLEETPVPKGNLLIVVGATKVPAEVYSLVDQNVAVGGQPHSEIGALAVYLYRARGLKKRFTGAKIRVVPSEKGKQTIASKG
ncbi:tRNA (cytidine(56)-2'-O)-methyltransferase [archaeon]